MQNGHGLLLILVVTTACRTTFDVAPGAAPFIANGQVYTTDGERVLVPGHIRGSVHARENARLGTYRPEGAPCHVATLFSRDDTSEAKKRGVDFDPIRFNGAHAVDGDGFDLKIADEERGCVLVPKAAVDHVEVVDVAARREKILAIVVPSVLGGLVAIGGLVAFSVVLANNPYQ